MGRKLKFLISFLLVMAITFGGGIILGSYQIAQATECSDQENESAFDIVKSIILGDKIYACTNDVYMGGYWVKSRIPVNTSTLDGPNAAVLRGYVNNAISHFNSYQTYRDFYSTTSSFINGAIYVYDRNLPGETYTAVANNAWKGGWPVDTAYDFQTNINIIINEDRFWANNSTVERTTVRHELGHSFGLGHRSDAATLMYCSRDGRTVSALTARDLSVIDIIY